MTNVAMAMADDPGGESPSAEQPLCMHCLAKVSPHDHFCPVCGGPLTSHASTDPLGHIFAEGYAYRQAVSGRPGLLVLLGVWAIFGPQMVMAIFMLAGAVRAPQSPFAVLSETIALLILVLYAAILAKVTANRFTRPAPPDAPT